MHLKYNLSRGHLSPAFYHSKIADEYKRSFYFWNIFPQNKNLNNGLWKRLEHFGKDLIMNHKMDEVYVYSGTLFMPKKECVTCAEFRENFVFSKHI